MIGKLDPRSFLLFVVGCCCVWLTPVDCVAAGILLPLQAPLAGDNFGTRVAFSGNTILVGGPGAGVSREGEVQVFVADNGVWQYETTLSNSSADRFGAGVALDGNRAVVGAPGSGTAYVYTGSGDTWALSAQMQGVGGFGFDVGVAGNMAIVGMEEGSLVHVFTSDDNWDEGRILGSGNYFGHSVGISGHRAVVGDYWTNTAHFYRYDNSDWILDGSVSRGDGNDQFGYSVAIDGDYAIVGANTTGAGGFFDTGSATIYRREADSTWVEEITLAPGELRTNDQFGYSVAIDGDFAAIGAIGQGPLGRRAGTVHVYQRVGATWSLAGKIQPEDGSHGDQFGCSLAISGDKIVIGAWQVDLDDFDDDDAGAAYVFDLPRLSFLPGDANRDGYVNEADAKILAERWGTVGAEWEDGDFDADGRVGPIDAALMAAHWGMGPSSRESASVATVAVPEPAIFGLFLSALACLIARPRSRST